MNKKIVILAAALLAVLLVASTFTVPLAFADASGPRSGTTFAGNVAITSGDFDWVNANNAASSNNVYATATVTGSSDISNYLRATGFGFTIPAAAVIQGIEVNIERSEANTQTATIFDNVVSLVKNNAVVGQDKGTSTAWPTTDAVATYGGASDLWGTTWTPAEINNSNFGVALSVGRTSGGNEIARVDHITIAVTYFVPSQQGPVPPSTQAGNIARTGGDVSWANSGNIFASDNSRATATLASSGDTTNYLRGTGFNFNIPAGSTIRGIQLNIEKSEGGQGSDEIRDSVVSLVKNNVIVGNNKAATTTDWPQPASETTTTYGSGNDLWGTTWTAEDINNANFGFVLSATITGSQDEQARVDAASMVVYYTPPANTEPTADAQNLGVDEDGELLITLSGNANDAGQTLTFEIMSSPSNGTLSGFNSTTGEVTYQPDANFNGADSFTFRVNDGFENSTSAIVSIAVNAINDAPVANPQDLNTDEDTPLAITLTATDIELDLLIYAIVDNPAQGVLTGFNSTTGEVTYEPASDFDGSDSFTFKVSDGTDDSNTATVSINVNGVNDAPVLDSIDSPQAVDELTLLTFNASATDPDISDVLTFNMSGAPLGASITDSGIFTWTPAEDQGPGSYTFDIVVSDGSSLDLQSMTVNVSEVNIAPVLNAIGNQTVTEETLVSILTGAVDPDLPENTLTFNATGLPTWAAIDPFTGEITGTPSETDDGVSLVTVTVEDGQGGSDSETFSLTVTEANTAPELNPIGNQTVDELATLSFNAQATDADLPANLLTFSLDGTVPSGASITPSGEFTFTPAEDQGPGSYTFDIVVSDGVASDSETITVTVNEVNTDPELANPGNQTLQEGSAVSIPMSATDADEPANTLSFSAIGLPSWASINATTGEITGTPGEGDDGASSVTVTVEDGQGGSDSETFELTVTDENTAPQLDSVGGKNVDEGSLLSFNATASDADLPGQTLTFSLSGEPSGAAITADGTFTWTPTEAQGPGDYTFDVVVSDGLASDSETITVTVNEVNTQPVLASIGHKFVDELATLSFNAQATDADLPANTISFSLSGSIPNGAAITPAGAFTWTPTEAQGPGDYTFDVVVSDGSATDSETITVTVNEVANTDITRPNIAITTPVDSETITGPSSGVTVHIEGTASDSESGIQEVMLRTETAAYQMVTPASPGNWSTWSQDRVFHTSGTHQLVARATDNDGNIRWFVININIEFGTDVTRPVVTITSPANGDTISGPTSGVSVLVEGTAFDGQSGVQLVEVRTQNTAYQAATPAAPGDWSSWSFDMLFASEGSQQVVARVTDNAGNMQWHIINVEITGPDAVRPTLAVTSPLDGETITGPSSGVTVHLEGTASDLSGVQIVESRTESTVYQPAIPAAPGDWSTWSRDVTFTTEGPHQLVVKATDNAGNMQWVIVDVNISFTS